MLKKNFNYYGYTFNKIKKSNTIIDIIKFRLKHNKCNTLLDIGANKGDFTTELLDCFKKKFLIEPNPNLINNLKDRFSRSKNLEISNCAYDCNLPLSNWDKFLNKRYPTNLGYVLCSDCTKKREKKLIKELADSISDLSFYDYSKTIAKFKKK